MKSLELKNVDLKFGGLSAIRNLSLFIKENQIFSLIGPNGAGKTSVFNAISRFYEINSGDILVGGSSILHLARHDLANIGVARTFQNIELFSNATVLENLLVACHSKKKTNFLSEILCLPKVRAQELYYRDLVEKVIDLLELQSYREKRPSELSYGLRKIVELGRALALEPKILLMDEPGSGLSVKEKQDLAFWIQDIREELGITVLLIEHDLNLVREVSDRVAVLSRGELIWMGNPSGLDQESRVVEAFIGK